MDRRIKIILFFIVVFALPVCWYLFLQFFGENQFSIDVIEKYDITSCEVAGPMLISRDDLISKYPNQFERVSRKVEDLSSIGFYAFEAECLKGFDLLLIDREMMIRGAYYATREDIDRLMAEIDIFVMNMNKTGNER